MGKICPIMAAGPLGYRMDCKEDRCAWFHMEYHQDGDYATGKCALLRIAEALTKGKEG